MVQIYTGLIVLLIANPPAQATPLQIYGVWHAGNDACIWGTVRTETEFDQKNHWIIDRGDGVPSVNLVILSFVQPLKLLRQDDRLADPKRYTRRHDTGDCELL